MPILIITPESRAEMWLGAAGWACGSQMCSGRMPALEPKPARVRKNTALFTPAGMAPMPAKASEPVAW